MRTIWAIGWTLIAATVLAGLALVGLSWGDNSIPQSATGLATFLIGIAAAHFSLDARWLKRARNRLDAERDRMTDDRVQLAAERIVMERDAERTRRELEELERQGLERVKAAQVKMGKQIQAQRDAALANVADHKAEIEREAFEVGFLLGKSGVAPEAARTNVVTLPRGEHARATMGTGTTNK